jgi:hypothetical protein
MTISDIRIRHRPERIDQRRVIINPPDRVSNTIHGGEIVQRTSCHDCSGQHLDIGTRSIHQKHRLCVRFQRKHMPGAVILFVLPGLLVLADYVALIIVHVDAPDETRLGSPLHDLAVEIQGRLAIPDEGPSRDESVERFARLPVYPWIVGIDIVGKVDVRSAHVQEAVTISPRELCRLVPAHDIIRNGGNLGYQLRSGPKRVERVESHVCVQPGLEN